MPIESTTALVQNILMMNSASRNSDNLLFYLVCKKLLGDQGIDIEKMGFVKLFLSLSAYGLPPFETVGRVRRKLQQDFPELRCNETVGQARSASQDAFMEFALDGRV